MRTTATRHPLVAPGVSAFSRYASCDSSGDTPRGQGHADWKVVSDFDGGPARQRQVE